MNITVYLGSNAGNRPVFRQAVQELGAWIGAKGHTLVYGGSRIGLMGLLAAAANQAGGQVIGVETSYFVDEQVQYTDLSQLLVTDTMAQRKKKLRELGDVFVAFPGGIGTLEEIAEVMTLAKIGQLNKPFCLLNIEGYYEPFRAFLKHMVMEGFLEEPWAREICFADSLAELYKFIEKNS